MKVYIKINTELDPEASICAFPFNYDPKVILKQNNKLYYYVLINT